LCPYFVSTKLSAMRKSLMSPLPDAYVNEAIKTIGTQPVTNGCLVHNIQVYLLFFLLLHFFAIFVVQVSIFIFISQAF
jgi:hypothetical protein